MTLAEAPAAIQDPLRPDLAERAPVPAVTRAQRLVSLDVFRGMTIAMMLLVNNPGRGEIYTPLEHAPWNGWTPTDLVFPFFLFIVGVAIPFSLSKRSSAARGRGELLGHIWLRALSLFMLGELLTGIAYVQMDPLPQGFVLIKSLRILSWIVCGAGIVGLLVPWKWKKVSIWFPIAITVIFYALLIAIHYAINHARAAGLPADIRLGNGMMNPSHLRIPGILQRIGICYGVAATIALYTGWRTVLTAAVVLMALYSALMLKMPYHDHLTGSLTREDNLARRIDEDVFGTHNYASYPDPEGLLSTLPAVASSLLGILVGLGLRSNLPNVEKCARLLAWGVFVTIIGVLLSWWLMPINKQIWTPSFTVFTAGLGMLTLGAVFWVVDVRGRRRWALPFVIYGMNAIAAFVAAGVVYRIAAVIRIDIGAEEKVSLVTLCKNWAVAAVEQSSNWLQQLSPHLPVINTPYNTSLLYAIGFVLVILVLMSVLYVLKIFIKV